MPIQSQCIELPMPLYLDDPVILNKENGRTGLPILYSGHVAITNPNYEIGNTSEIADTSSVTSLHSEKPFNSPTEEASPNTVRTGLKCFCNWLKTPLGMLITIYGLNVIAWGGMLFLLICNAAPAMCHPTCDDIYSARKKWIEIDSQILNALFCVPGFGLAPWRIRDLYFWVKWRVGGEHIALARLCDIHRSWFYHRPKDNDVEEVSTPTVCVTASPPWKLDLVIWCNSSNTMFQACLAGCMWGMDRFNRPSWTTGLFVALACGVAGFGGCISYAEGRRTRMLREVL